MAERDPRCVLVVPEAKAAELIAAWLTEKGYPAESVYQPPDSIIHPGAHHASITSGEFQVRVAKSEHVAPARDILEEQRAGIQALQERESRRATRTGTVNAVCEECGQASDWPAAEMGTTQDCPHCGKYMDVPDPDENWDDIDFENIDADAVHPETDQDPPRDH